MISSRVPRRRPKPTLDLAPLTARAHAAWRQGEALADQGDARAALPWLDRAHRLAPSDQNLRFALAWRRLQAGEPAAAAPLFADMARRFGSPECWAGLAACHVATGDVQAAREAVATALSTNAVDAALARLADQLAGPQGWCGLGAGFRLLGADPAKLELLLDGAATSGPTQHARCLPQATGRLAPLDAGCSDPEDVRRPGPQDTRLLPLQDARRPDPQNALRPDPQDTRLLSPQDAHPSDPHDPRSLPPHWRTARRLDVLRHGEPLLGSPISLAAITRTEGMVRRHGSRVTGHAWHPAAPDADPELRVLSETGSELARLTATEPTATIDGTTPLARPRGFACDVPLHLTIHVVGPDGRDLLGSPLPPDSPAPRSATSTVQPASSLSATGAASVPPSTDAASALHAADAASAPPPPDAAPIPHPHDAPPPFPHPTDAPQALTPPRQLSKHVPDPALPVNVVIPVYRGLRTTLDCIAAVLATLAPPHRLTVVDDNTPDPDLAEALDRLAQAGSIHLLRPHPTRNLGFPAAANAGLSAAPGHHVILLNSDTLVAPLWLETLRDAACSAPDIGTATPLSNEASIFSYPDPDGGNPAPTLTETHRLARLAARANPGPPVDVPTAHGFCMFVRADCLAETGLLDQASFAQGYGEENDFTERARALGWRHVAVPATFVAHLGGVSFGGAGAQLLRRNLAILEQRYPTYRARIAAHIAADPLAAARRRLDAARFADRTAPRSVDRPAATGANRPNVPGADRPAATGADRPAATGANRPAPTGADRPATRGPDHPATPGTNRPAVSGAVLLVTHGGGGGTARIVAERAHAIAAEGATPILLRAVDGLCEVSAPDEPTPNLVFELPRETGALIRLLRPARPIRAELHHLLGHHHAILGVIAGLAIPYDAWVHDYAWFCARLSFTTGQGRFCGEAEPATCEACLATWGRGIEDPVAPAELRRRSAADLARARAVIVPSADVARRVVRHAPAVCPTIQPWEADPPCAPASVVRRTAGPVRVAVIGAIGQEKGYDVLLACARDAAARALNLAFTIIGYTEDDDTLMATGRVFITGEFTRNEAPSLIEAQRAQLAFLPSIWPETWCYALSDAWSAGLSAAVFDIGTPAERVRSAGRGWVLPLGLPPAVVCDALLRLCGEADY